MTLPPIGAGGGRRSRRGAGAVLLVGLALALAIRPGRAEETDPYTATVAVDATADSVVKAREMARLDGERRALAAVLERAAGGGAVKLPKLDDNAITDLVASFEVANERMSAVRYLADYTFHFQPAGIQRLLGNAGIAAAAPPGGPGAAPPGSAGVAQPGKPLVVIPVYQPAGGARLWDDPNPWRDAWQQPPSSAGAPALLLPLGDTGDMSALDAEKAQAGDAAGLAAIAKRNGGGDAIVALAAPRAPVGGSAGLDVTVRRYRAGQLVDTHSESLTANPGESEADLLRRAAATTVSNIEGGWKKEVAGYDQQGTLTAVLPITGLDDWVRARQLLAGIGAIRKITLMALSRQEATIEIGYVGSIDQLKSGLAGIDLVLVPGAPTWRLARAAAGRSP